MNTPDRRYLDTYYSNAKPRAQAWADRSGRPVYIYLHVSGNWHGTDDKAHAYSDAETINPVRPTRQNK